MDLDPQIAETIVGELKGIFNHEINLFDTTGTIIASTDRSRIGTSHDGARLVLRTKQPITIDNEHDFKGARHGINVPVLFNGQAVAVIGITGAREEVEPFGNVIKKMCEILIREQWEQISRFDQRERLKDLATLLCIKRHDAELANYLASVLEIDLTHPRRCVVGRLVAEAEGTCPAQGADSAYTILYTRFQQFKDSFFAVSGNEIKLFVGAADERALEKLLRSLREVIHERLGESVIFGIGDVAEDSSSLWRSYEEATKTVDWLQFSQGEPIGRFSDMDYGVLLSSVSTKDARQLCRRVFGGLTEEQIADYERVFDAYTRHNGSISHCAEELFFHKNTLQNRLNKMARETGYNPRELADYAVLAVAFKMHRYLKFGLAHKGK